MLKKREDSERKEKKISYATCGLPTMWSGGGRGGRATRDESFDRVLSHPPSPPLSPSRHKLRPSLTLTHSRRSPSISVSVCVCMYIYSCICMCVYMYNVYIYSCMCVCIFGATPFSVSTSSPCRLYIHARTSPLVINTFARIPEPFCPGRTFAAAKDPPSSRPWFFAISRCHIYLSLSPNFTRSLSLFLLLRTPSTL